MERRVFENRMFRDRFASKFTTEKGNVAFLRTECSATDFFPEFLDRGERRVFENNQRSATDSSWGFEVLRKSPHIKASPRYFTYFTDQSLTGSFHAGI